MKIILEIDPENRLDQMFMAGLIPGLVGGRRRGGEEKKKRVPPKTPSQKHKKHKFRNKCFWCGSGCWGHLTKRSHLDNEAHICCRVCYDNKKRRRTFEQAKAEATLHKLGRQIDQREAVAPTKKADEAKIEG